MRKIDEYVAMDGRKVKVYYNSEQGEYIVKFYNHQGIHMDASDYFTNDKKDALGTARLAIRKCDETA